MANHYHFYKVPHEIVTQLKFKNMRPSTRCIYHTLCRLGNLYGNTDGWFFRSINDLVEDTGLSRKTVIESKKELIKNNFVDHERGQYKSTGCRAPDVYRINGFILKLSDA
jgi:DNA-binding MarR family transcriptional regulator